MAKRVTTIRRLARNANSEFELPPGGGGGVENGKTASERISIDVNAIGVPVFRGGNFKLIAARGIADILWIFISHFYLGANDNFPLDTCHAGSMPRRRNENL